MTGGVVGGRRDVSLLRERYAAQIVEHSDRLRVYLIRVEEPAVKRAIRIQLLVDEPMQPRVALGGPFMPGLRRSPNRRAANRFQHAGGFLSCLTAASGTSRGSNDSFGY